MIENISLALIYSLMKDALGWLRHRGRRLSPQEVLQLRQKWKPLFEERIQQQRRDSLRTDVIIRDMKRIDTYPNLDDKRKGISPWFRVGLLDVYHKGIQVGLRWESLIKDPRAGKLRYSDFSADETNRIKAILIGYIPFDWIEAVEWDGDEFYGFAHIYCYFGSKRKEPYERLAFCEERKLDHIIYYSEIEEYDEVRKLSKARGIER